MRIILFFVSSFHFTGAIWWWFNSGGEKTANKQANVEASNSITELSQVFAPFEISNGEEKFLKEAKNYLQNLPMLDQCNMLIINRLKSSCHQLSDEQLSKLSVNLLNCQSAVEGRKTYKCTEDMKLADCTGSMDSDTWNSYHIISNRARALCYNIRQTQFRMKTEHTVNQLASTTLDNIDLLKQLAIGQKKMQEVTEEAVSSLSENQDQLLANQNSLKDKQSLIGGILQRNMKDILKEKRLIADSHHQVEQYTQMINEQLDSLSREIKSQDQAKKESQKEILKDLDSVKMKADEVLQKLGSTFDDMDSYHEGLESKQNQTLKNLEEIQETIAFMNDLLQKLYATFDESIPWLQNMFGGTVDKLTIVTILFGHMGFFLASFFSVIFLNAPMVTRIMILVMIPVNCIAMIHEIEIHLNYLQMAWLLVASIPANFCFEILLKCITRLRNDKDLKPIAGDDSQHQFTFNTPEAIKGTSEFDELIKKEQLSFTPADKFKNSFHENVESSSPVRYLQFNWSPKIVADSPVSRRFIDSTFDNSSPRLNTTIGGSIKCNAKTRTGAKCKNSAVGCTTTCRVHTPQK